MSERGGLSGWRLVKAAYAGSAFDGEGAFRFGGRWNSKGIRVVYAAESLALAALEWLVHLDPAAPLREVVAFRLEIPAGVWVDPLEESAGCRRLGGAPFPALSATRGMGDRWARGGASPVLRVPSAVIPVENNFVLNPRHAGFGKIVVSEPEGFAWDGRLPPRSGRP